MVRLLAFAVAGLVAWFVLRRRTAAIETVTIGWEDGSSVSLDHGAARRQSMIQLAEGALPR